MDKEIGIGPARLNGARPHAALRRHQRRSDDRRPRHGDPRARCMRTWGHQDFGIYAKVVAGGIVAVGSAVSAPAAEG